MYMEKAWNLESWFWCALGKIGPSFKEWPSMTTIAACKSRVLGMVGQAMMGLEQRDRGMQPYLQACDDAWL